MGAMLGPSLQFRMKAFIIALSVAGIWLLLPIQSARGTVLYQVVDLGTVNGAFRSEARGINQNGEVWGENFNSDFPYFLWFDNTNHGIAKPAEVPTMALYGMNEERQFAGFFSYSQPARNTVFLGSPLRPQSLNQTNFSPRGVNIHGDVVGITAIKVEIYPGGPLALVNRPALVHGKQLTILPSLAGSTAWLNAEATAINDSGVIVGWSATSSNVTHAFMWDGAMHDLHALGSRSNSFAVAVNNNGTVAGYTYNYSIYREPFVWTASNSMTALSLPGGYTTGQPLGLNNRGDIVGVADSSAALWTNGVMTDLQTVIPTSPSWDLDGAYGINDAGQIVGYGKNGGLTKGFLLQPTNVPPVQFKIELLDPGDPSATNALAGATVTTNTAILNALTIRRAGVAADGASRLLARVTTTNHGTVTLSLRAADGAAGVTGDQTEDGGVGNVGGYGGFTLSLTRYETSTENTAQGIRAYALYHAPDIFHRTGGGYDDSALFQRTIYLQAVFTPDSGPAATQSVAIAIARPPLIVLHGIWSDSDLAFGGFIKAFRADEASLQLFDPDYPNAISFASNATVVPDQIANACIALREQNFACTRADIFAHSMGGVLSRIYAGRADYKRPENYGLGGINRLVTIDSPHRGAIFADAVNRVFNWLDSYGMTDVHEKMAKEMTRRHMPPELGAGYDLLTASPAIADMNQRVTDVATHVIVGDFTLEVNLKTLPQPFGGFYSWLDGIPGLELATRYFAPVPGSDLIVSTNSQYAGLTDDDTTTRNHFHVGAANTTNVMAKCMSLYEKPPSHNWYAKGFPTGWIAPAPPPLQPGPAGLLKLLVHAILLYFAAGPDVNSGATISASVSEPPGTNFTSVLLLTRDAALTDTNAPFNFMLPIPADAVGDYPVSYYATDTASNLWSGTQTLSVTPLASLNYLEAAPRRFIFTRLGSQEQIIVTGVYFDRPRNVTDPSTGTTYSSADTNVVTMETNGVMTARGSGATRITIFNNGKNAFVDLVVDPLPSPDLALTQTPATSNAFAGVPVVFTLRVTNVGPETADSVYLADPLPAGAQFQSATASQGTWTYTNGLFAAALGALAPASNATATLTLVFTNGGAHINTATVSAIGLDANSTDNSATAVVNITVLPVLTIQLTGTNIILSWPTNATGFELERTSNLTPPPVWNPAATNPPTIGDRFELTLPPTNAPAYFRLRHP